ncbi:SpoIIE family protein phosphatase [Streptomyces sp. H10-C2]|uniref:SpoIIE family protein phosphatase n=1 Tax=unclassified Streptomyces TaxID=2593676 RepID=UPI0024B8D7F8|nr:MULTISPECIES: SpoIIE family protein phosphatase [unclassified Streptomyces]MDJ0340326.1 SpoIIE family protein phosphatase [Streptomyces sp. PH10-H1]MDJ0368226.1 SpoIIE family protein phosphatase [Streptomyces sp. H10-C2]
MPEQDRPRDRGEPPDTATPRSGPAERLALNHMGSFDWNLRLGTLELDAAGLEVFDLLPEEFTGRPECLSSRVTTEDAARLDAAVSRAVHARDSSYGMYFQVHCRDGTPRWTHTQGRILRDDQGRPERVIGIVRDATSELAHSTLLRTREEDRKRQTSMVERTTQALSRAVTVDDVTAVLTGSGGLERFGADGLVLSMVEGSMLRVLALTGRSMEVLDALPRDRIDDNMPTAEVVVTQRPRFFASLKELADRYPRLRPLVKDLRIEAAAFLPLVAQAHSIGALGLFYRDRTHFTAEDRNLCLALAGIVAQSLQRAMLFDQEREFATGLQASMLPRRIPEVTGGEIAVRYHAAWSGREVGGDWYDVIPLPQGRIGVVVGDVEGHDTHAAAMMGQLRIVLRAYAAEGHAPSTVLARASQFLAELDTERFATCIYAQADLVTGDVRVVRAGHLGPLIRHTDGRTGWPNVRGGLPLGLATHFNDHEYPETRLDLVPGETLLLCTDGLVEQPGKDIGEGMDELADAVRRGPHGAAALADHLSDGLWARPGAEDDMALLLLRRAPDPGTAHAPRIHQYIHQADPEGLAEARAVLRQALYDWGASGLVDDVELVAGELLTNVLLHTEGGAVMTLEILPAPQRQDPRQVRLAVQDRSSVWPRRRTPGESATSGRGLLLIDSLATRWGVEPRGEGKSVWAEFRWPPRSGDQPEAGTGGTASS